MTTISKSYQLSDRLMMIVSDRFWSFMIVLMTGRSVKSKCKLVAIRRTI